MRKFTKNHKYLNIVVIVLCLIIGIAFLPFLLGGLIGFNLYKRKISSKKKWAFISLTVFLAFMIGVPWAAAFFSRNTKTANVAQVSSTPTPETIFEADAIDASVSTTPSSVVTLTTTPASHSPENSQNAKVVRVIDGDTMDFSIEGKTERIRVIGINTPETVDPRKSVECFGQEASRIAKLYLEPGTEVELEKDPTQGDKDKYSRLLRYVWTDDGSVDFGKVMISLGYAYEYTYNTPYKYQAVYKNAQKEAEANKKGLWADGVCTVTPKPITSVNTSTSTSTTTYSGKYSCTGPDLDCSDFQTHTEAQSFFNSCGFSATNDPMRLDRATGTGNGIACESLP